MCEECLPTLQNSELSVISEQPILGRPGELDEPMTTSAETNRLNTVTAALGMAMIRETSNITPVMEMTAACGCGACGVCRTAFAGGVITAAVTKVKSFFSRKRDIPQPES
jgi:hypothetical protein